jgi:hypothetical protein
MIRIACTILLAAQAAPTGDGSPPAPPQVVDGHSGLVFGDNHAFWLTAPPGWVLDNKSGVSDGLQAVFYPAGQSWRDGIAVMYSNAASKQVKSLAVFIAGDVDRFKSQSPKISVRDAPSAKTRDGKTATVKLFRGDAAGNSEAVAYVEEDKVFVLIVLSSRNERAFEQALPAFLQLVQSYQFMTENVRFAP